MVWMTLMDQGELPYRPPAHDPGALMVQPEWRELLERAVEGNRNAHWLASYHLGVMRYRAGDRAGARQAYERSIAQEPSPWAYRDLAVMARDEGDAEKAADLWLTAARMAPTLVPLAIETAAALSRAGPSEQVIAFVDALPHDVRGHGRIRLMHAAAALALGDLASVEEYFQGDVDVANVREKETTLSDLWFGWQQQRVARERGLPIDDNLRQLIRKEFPPPLRFDFRLNTDLA
jgi:tetratricopeptide (TPR) repeat protein